MFLREFRFDNALLVQGTIQFPLVALPEADTPSWWTLYQRLIQNASAISSTSLAARISLRPDGSLERAYAVLAPQHEARALRQYLATFTRLDIVVPGSVTVPLRPDQYKAVFAPFPEFRIAVRPPDYRAGDVWFACGFRVASILDDLISQATTRGYGFTYQVNVSAIESERDLVREALREARLNTYRVERLAGAPSAAVALQTRLVRKLTATSAICEEYVGATTRETSKWLSAALSREFDRTFRAAQFEVPAFEVVERGFEESIAVGVHTALLRGKLDARQLVDEAVADAEVPALVGWRPGATTLAQLSAATTNQQKPDITSETPDKGVEKGLFPPPSEVSHGYLFVSYKRLDAPRIAPVLQLVQKLGYQFWYDDGIPGGSEWDIVIEQRLEGAAGILFFLSREAVLSRYVRREVKFADMIRKPIVTVKLENAELTHGFGVLLSQYQMIDTPASPTTLAGLRRALAFVFAQKNSPSPV